MQAALRILYACGLALWLVPAAVSRIRRSGLATLRPAELLALRPAPSSLGPNPLWVHAVSVGELRAAEVLLAEIRKAHGDKPILLTCTTEAARSYAAERMGIAALALPLDFASVMRRFVRAHAPRACILLEQELWPNLIGACREAGIPVVVANGRMSARSARRYARCLPLMRTAFAGLAAVAAADRTAARRFAALGAQRVTVAGNLKHDAQPDPAQISAGRELGARMKAAAGGKPVILLASTRPGEERLLLPELRKRMGNWPLIVAVRHPERAGEVAGLLQGCGWQPVRRSQAGPDEAPACMLADTLGEMAVFAAAADAAFVGGSLLPYGGQNPLEQLALGVPVVMGPYRSSIRELARSAHRAGALAAAADAAEAARLLELMAGSKEAAGAAGMKLAAELRGAAGRCLGVLAPSLDRS